MFSALREWNPMLSKTRHYLLFTMLLSSILFSCSNISTGYVKGFGVWSDDCQGIAVAYNAYDWDSGIFMNHETNSRSGLHLCDTNGTIVKTLYLDRKIDGAETKIDSIDYVRSQNYLIVYTILFGTGNMRKERINATTGAIESSEEMISRSFYSYYVKNCNDKKITWIYDKKWIELIEE
jgi:hypothetical protein